MKPFFLPLALAASISSLAAQPAVPTRAADVNPAKIGTTLPPIALVDVKNQPFDLNAAVAKAPAVLVFYRGGWCPFCNAQLAALAKIEPQLKTLGYQIIAVTPDSPSELSRTLGKQPLSYTLLSDSKMSAARALGLAFRVDDETFKKYQGFGLDLEKSSGEKHHLLPVPAVYLVGKDGLLNFSYVNPNYKVRLNGDVLLAAAKAYK
ncbi:MAG: AhpC/TSA family protein [Armatimonadetes bacterium]|nr:AhpC/TSA family protein [Armatimonadota bacterium]